MYCACAEGPPADSSERFSRPSSRRVRRVLFRVIRTSVPCIRDRPWDGRGAPVVKATSTVVEEVAPGGRSDLRKNSWWVWVTIGLANVGRGKHRATPLNPEKTS